MNSVASKDATMTLECIESREGADITNKKEIYSPAGSQSLILGS